MSRKIIRRLLTEAVQGSEIKIQRLPSIGYLIVNDQGAETVARDEVDLMNVLRSFKEVGIKAVNDAISGEFMSIDQYIVAYGDFIEDFEEEENYDPLAPDSVMTSADYIPEPDSAIAFNDELEDDVNINDELEDDVNFNDELEDDIDFTEDDTDELSDYI